MINVDYYVYLFVSQEDPNQHLYKLKSVLEGLYKVPKTDEKVGFH